MISNNKENYIYVKYNSLTSELCEEVIDKLNNQLNIFMFNTNTQSYQMMCDHSFGKLQNILIHELNKNMAFYKMVDYNGINLNSRLEKTLCNAQFCIQKKMFENDKKYKCINIENRITIHDSVKIKMLQFIWILNDNLDYIFWGYHKISTKIGTFILFPISWCFPYSEIINSDKCTIQGIIYL